MIYSTREHHFSESEIKNISERFFSFAKDGCMTLQQFKKSMGLLGVGEAEYLSNRIFSLITDSTYCTSEEFIEFLEKINYGSFREKVELSFNYLDRGHSRSISFNDIQVIINEIAFVWNFLTGEKISTTELIEVTCQKLGISQKKAIEFEEYLEKYDQFFNWYDFFNSPTFTSRQDEKAIYHSIRNSSNEFKIDQIEEYIKLIHNEIQGLIYDFREEETFEHYENTPYVSDSKTNEVTKKGPKTISTQELQPKGDFGYHYRDTLPYLSQEQLAQQLSTMQQDGNIYDVIASKLQQISDISSKLFKDKGVVSGRQREKTAGRLGLIEEEKKKTLRNITEPSKKRRNIVYFGHESWNIMLNMMLGMSEERSEEEFEVALLQVVADEPEGGRCNLQVLPRTYIQEKRQINQVNQRNLRCLRPQSFLLHQTSLRNRQLPGTKKQSQVLKSIGLENLIGNLVLGKLSTITDQTSEGKSGSFMYYTEDSKIIVKSISREEYLKLRNIVEDYAYYVQNNPQTYIMRIYGLYKMKNKSSQRSIYFIVIGNVFDQDIDIDERYDIKGATYNRQLLTPEQHSEKHRNVALKDVDLINNHNRNFDIDQSTKQSIYQQILRDVEFLKEHTIIEYSLLIGVHYCKPGEQQRREKESWLGKGIRQRQVVARSSKQTYFFGIIDILSEYTAAKRLENGFFSMLNYDISCKDPEQYYERFKNFIYKYVFSF